MMQNPHHINRVDIEIPEGAAGIFSVISGYGFIVDAPIGVSVKTLLVSIPGFDADYVENHIGTILHDGKPVDDIETWTIDRPATIALSGALPGIFGAAFRRHGRFAALRPREMPAGNDLRPRSATIPITLKLFNLTAKEIGPALLQKGVRMTAGGFRSLWKNVLTLDTGQSVKVWLDGSNTDPGSLAQAVRSEHVLLCVTTR